MTDIVERIRKRANAAEFVFDHDFMRPLAATALGLETITALRHTAKDVMEAADEIERLRKEVRRMKRELSKIETDADYARFKLAVTVSNEQKER